MQACNLRTAATTIGLISLSSLAASAHAEDATGGKPPELDMHPTCQGAAGEDLTLKDKPTLQSCLDEEAAARQKLQGVWTTFPENDRRHCMRSTQTGGPPSYVNLLWCLQDAKTAREIAEKPT
jgi:hypothetical protein